MPAVSSTRSDLEQHIGRTLHLSWTAPRPYAPRMCANDNRTVAGMSSLANVPTSFRVETLTKNEWRRLRDIRLTALRQSPRSFLATYGDEKTYGRKRWRSEFERGEWSIVLAD